MRLAAPDLVQGKTFSKAAALQVLAPAGSKYNHLSWKETLAGGKISQLDIVRNYRRPPDERRFPHEEPRLTMQRVIEPLRYRVVEAASPTNPKEGGQGENTMQLADLFLVNEYWPVTRSGIVTPSGQLKPVDDSALSATRTYWKISDHSPVLMLGSTMPDSDAPHIAFTMAKSAADQAVATNHAIWDGIGNSLKEVATRSGTPAVAKRIAAIKGELNEPLTGPGKAATAAMDRVHHLAAALKIDIETAEGVKLSEAQVRTLDRMAEWQPFYTTDFGEEAPEKEQSGKPPQKPPERVPPERVPPERVPPERVPPEREPPEGIPQGVQEPQPAWSTGEVAHWNNSCYLSALIHVLASDENFAGMLSTSLTTPREVAGFRNASRLRSLVGKLQDPRATITAAEIETFMKFLDARGVLGDEPGGGGKKTGKQDKAKLISKASKVAEKATKAKTAVGLQLDASAVLRKVLTALGPSTAIESTIRNSLAPSVLPWLVTSYADERQTILELPIPRTGDASIASALRAFSADSEAPGYKGIGGLPYVKRDQFAVLPQVLTIALKRFKLTGEGVTAKETWKVMPELTLQIPDECMTPELRLSPEGQNATYRLQHVVHHEGTLNRGHYTSFGKLAGTETWYKHDDRAFPAPRRTIPSLDEWARALVTGYIYVYVKNPLPEAPH